MTELLDLLHLEPSLDDVPLHHASDAWTPHAWWACQEPERPADRYICVDSRCSWCRLKGQYIVSLGQGLDIGARFWGTSGRSDGVFLPFDRFMEVAIKVHENDD